MSRTLITIIKTIDKRRKRTALFLLDKYRIGEESRLIVTVAGKMSSAWLRTGSLRKIM